MKALLNPLYIVVVLVAVIACEPPQKESPQLSSGVLVENMDTTVNPGDNFQMYVNGTWIKNTEIPADKSSYGTMTVLREESQEDVKTIIEEAASSEAPEGSDEQKVGDLFASFMNMDKRNELGVAPIEPELDKINNIKSYDDMQYFIAESSIKGLGGPVAFWVSSDFKNPDINTLYTWQRGLGLPDREYYLSDEGKNPEIREKYVSHIAKMFELAGLDNADAQAKTIMDIETAIAGKHLRKEETRDRNKMYNKFPVDSLDALMPNWDWKSYFTTIGLPDLEHVIVTQPSYVLALDDILTSYSVDDWKSYLRWRVVNDAANYLNKELDDQDFEFYSKTLRGTPEPRPMWRRGVSVVNGVLGEVVGKVYVSKHFPPEAKERMSELVGNLIKAYEASIKDLDWMGEETKQEALKKLSKFDPKIGYPDKWKDYSDLVIDAEDLFGNIKRSNMVEHYKDIAKVGQPVDRTEWGMTPQTVNAYYNPSKNEVVFPAAILQSPFFDMSADDATNYGAIGGVIGHEIGHGFDDQGSKTDGDGVLRNWWTDEDRTEFEKRTGALVEQYSSFKVFDDLNVNGEFTLGENIGDLGGLTIAMKAYKMSLGDKEPEVIDGFTGYQRVFIGWAQGWAGKSREEALRMQVSTDPHSPRDFRVNGVVRNIPEFYEAFDVQPGDSLYLAPEERVKIW